MKTITINITGPQGSGKSILAQRIFDLLHSEGHQVKGRDGTSMCYTGDITTPGLPLNLDVQIEVKQTLIQHL